MINTLTLNPAIDHILYLGRFHRNITNRLTATAESIGGKGTHVSVNLALMGTPSRAFGIGFGQNGLRILGMLRDAGVEACFLSLDGQESRDNYLLVEEETRDCTLIVEKGPQPGPEDLAAFFNLLKGKVCQGEDVLLSGDTSNFPGQDIYGRVLELLADKKPRVFLDASGPALREGVKRRPFLIKPNLDELSILTGTRISGDSEVISAIRGLEPYGIPVIAVSLGGEGALVRAEDRLLRARPPKVKVYNTVGCGDCFMAGLMHGFSGQQGAEEALRWATAVSAAKAETPLSVGFDMRRARELLEQVTIETL